MRIVLFACGILAILMGLLWVAQGLGLLMWPQSSFMLADRQWAIYGALVVAMGSYTLWLATKVEHRQ